MGLPRKLLGADERVVIHLRTHVKALILPCLLLISLVGVTAVTWGFLPPAWRGWSGWVLLAIVVVLAVPLVLVPGLRWWTATYTLTTRRVITRRGILTKTGHDLPLARINNVTYERSLLDRMLGCGTLRFTTAAEEPVTLPDVPDVERVHVAMTELLFGDPDRSADPSD